MRLDGQAVKAQQPGRSIIHARGSSLVINLLDNKMITESHRHLHIRGPPWIARRVNRPPLTSLSRFSLLRHRILLG